MEIHEIIKNNGIVTADGYRDITLKEVIKKIAEILTSGQKIAVRLDSNRDEIISFYKGKRNMNEHFCLLFNNEDDIQEKLMNILKSIKQIEFF